MTSEPGSGMLDPVIITGWRTSSRCDSGACVEAGNYRKSSRSAACGNCLEAGVCRCGVSVRDTTDREGPVLTFGPEAWREFTSALKAADLPH